MKLNLGCNKHQLPGYINVDIEPFDEADEVWDATDIPLPAGSIDEIYAGHLLEHIPNPFDFFIECYRLLEDDGLLTVVVPDSTATPERHILIGILFGFWIDEDGLPDPDLLAAMHRTWWTKGLLRSIGCHTGFEFVDYVDPWEDEHLLIGADWHVGVIFRKGHLEPDIAHALNFYREILQNE